jgi:hypothetical protein
VSALASALVDAMRRIESLAARGVVVADVDIDASVGGASGARNCRALDVSARQHQPYADRAPAPLSRAQKLHRRRQVPSSTRSMPTTMTSPIACARRSLVSRSRTAVMATTVHTHTHVTHHTRTYSSTNR